MNVVDYAVSDAVATITLDRPGKGNAWGWDMCEQLEDALETADHDGQVRAVLLAGRGRHFCVGMDLDAFDTLAAPGHEQVDGANRDSAGRVTLRMLQLRKPVVAALHGACVGVGTTMTLAADVRIAGAGARFGLPFSRLGVVPEGASTWLLPRIVGISQALEWVLTARLFDADEALRGGLVSRVVADDEVHDVARALAVEMAMGTAPRSQAVARRLLWSMLGEASPWEAHRQESVHLHRAAASDEVRAAIAAFRAGETPHFPPLDDDSEPPSWP